MWRAFEQYAPNIFLPISSALVQAPCPDLVVKWHSRHRYHRESTRNRPRNHLWIYTLDLHRVPSQARASVKETVKGPHQDLQNHKQVVSFLRYNFSFNISQNLHGPQFTIAKQSGPTIIHYLSFTVRVINSWNPLPIDVVMVSSINFYKARLNRARQSVFRYRDYQTIVISLS